jgi:hypothetical protein
VLNWASEMVARSVLRGMTQRMRPIAFSTPPFCQGGIGVAEEGLDREPVQPAMARELGAVVEGEAATQAGRQLGEQLGQVTSDGLGSLVGGPHGDEQAGLPFVHGEDRLAVF